MWKALIVFVVAALLTLAAFLVWRFDLPAPSDSAAQVAVLVRKANGLGALRVELVYDSAAGRVEAVEVGELARNALLECNVKTPGRVVIGLVDVEGIKGDGAVAVLTFKPAAGGSTVPISFRKVEAYHAETRYELAPRAVPGKLAGSAESCVAPTLDFGRE